MRLRRPVVVPWLLVPLLLVPLLLGGCSGGTGQEDDAQAGGPTASPASPASTAPPASGGCPATDDPAPTDVSSAPTVDVDGDGAPDTAWIAREPAADGGIQFG